MSQARKVWSSTSSGLVAAATGLLLTLALTSAPAFASTIDTQSYLGTAYGTSAYVGNTVLVGQTAPVTLGGTCGSSQYPLNYQGTAAGVNVAPLVTGGAVNTSVSNTAQSAQATADTASINLLGGLITAQEIKAVSSTSILSDGTFQLSSAGSTFSNLVILGQVYNGSVPANTRIDLPLLGYVVLNEQTSNIEDAMASLTVNMIHIHITALNILGLQVGTEIVVSNAKSGMINVFAPAVMSGQSFGTQVTGTLLASTPTAPVILPCLGTNGAYMTNSLGSLNLPSILTSGTILSSGESNLTNNRSTAQMVSTIEGLNLLNGLVTANVLFAQVNAAVDGNLHSFSAGVDRVIGLSVAGHPEINDNVPNNTSVPLAGLGTLYLKRIIHTAPPTNSIEVRSVELVVLQNNSYGLPVGLDVIVGDAQIQIVPDANPQ